MLFDAMIIAKLPDVDDILPYPKVPAGVYEYDKAIYHFAYDKSKNPIMLNPFLIHSGEDVLEDGYYEVALSLDKEFLFLIQGGELKAKVPVIKVEEDKKIKEELEKQKTEQQEALEKTKKKNRKTKKLEDNIEHKSQLEMEAKIYDSKEGYYIIEYRKNEIKAWGYVPK